ncbi:type II toxin-antitoxin system VapC family toxin [soil metagenome]
MLVCDVNVLIAAYRADHPHHAGVFPWWDETLASGERIHVPDIVWVGFVRIVTSPRIFTVPSTIGEACDFAEAVRAHPAYTGGWTSDATFSTFADMCRRDQVSGNLVTDAWIAATALVMAAPVATLDRDFRRFNGLSIVEPYSPA